MIQEILLSVSRRIVRILSSLPAWNELIGDWSMIGVRSYGDGKSRL